LNQFYRDRVKASSAEMAPIKKKIFIARRAQVAENGLGDGLQPSPDGARRAPFAPSCYQ
jgi:hypothetical protein